MSLECDWNQIMIPHVSLLEEIMFFFFFSHLYTNNKWKPWERINNILCLKWLKEGVIQTHME